MPMPRGCVNVDTYCTVLMLMSYLSNEGNINTEGSDPAILE